MTKTAFSRRGLLDLALVAAGSAALPKAAAAEDASSIQIGDAFVAIADTAHTMLRPEAIILGARPTMAWPADRKTGVPRDGLQFNQVLLLRVPAAASDELVAFTAICPHAGCAVSEWVEPTGRLLCPCHHSEYDPTRSGLVTGGPSPLPLPTMPVRVTDGLIVVDGPFSAKPGAHVSRTM